MTWSEVLLAFLKDLEKLRSECELRHLEMTACSRWSTGGGIVKIFVAGDFFHKPKVSSDLLSAVAAFTNLDWYAIGGNHDFTNHAPHGADSFVLLSFLRCIKPLSSQFYLDRMIRGKVISVSDSQLSPVLTIKAGEVEERVQFSGHHFKSDLVLEGLKKPKDSKHDNRLVSVALLHEYIKPPSILRRGEFHPEKSASCDSIARRFRNFDLVVAGDNHRHFANQKDTSSCIVLNCGTPLPRSIAEKKYKPSVFLLCRDISKKRTARPYCLVRVKIPKYYRWRTSEELTEIRSPVPLEMGGLAKELREAEASLGSAAAAVKEWVTKSSLGDMAKSILLKALEEAERQKEGVR